MNIKSLLIAGGISLSLSFAAHASVLDHGNMIIAHQPHADCHKGDRHCPPHENKPAPIHHDANKNCGHNGEFCTPIHSSHTPAPKPHHAPAPAPKPHHAPVPSHGKHHKCKPHDKHCQKIHHSQHKKCDPRKNKHCKHHK